MERKIQLSAIMIQDPKAGGFTAYLAELPEAIAEGETVETALNNLKEAFITVLEVKGELGLQAKSNSNVIRKNFDLEFA